MQLSYGVLTLLGISLVGGIASALLMQKMRVPQVLGFIGAGLILGGTGFEIITLNDVELLQPFNNFALGIIGILVGGELKFESLKKYAPQYSSILIGEGVLSCILVALATGTLLYLVTGSIFIAFAGGVTLGSIASATDPASTMSVLSEYKTAGILTTTIIAVIALDDALAMILYGLAVAIGRVSSGTGGSATAEVIKVLLDLLISLAFGLFCGWTVTQIMKKAKKSDQGIALSLGVILLSIGVSVIYHLDIVLVTMCIGILLINLTPLRSREIFSFLKTITLPIYSVFFVLIGARIQLNQMPIWLWGVIALYIIFRTFGKYFGTRWGAKFSGADIKVVNYAGMGLFAQGGVAIGLALMAARNYEHIEVTETLLLSDVIVFTIATSTFFVQILGPLTISFIAKKSGEAGRDINEADIIESKIVKSCTSSAVPKLPPSASVALLMEVFSKSDFSCIPIVDKDETLRGVVSIDEVRDILLTPECWDWIIVNDIMRENPITVMVDQPLKKGLTLLSQTQLTTIPVVDNGRFCGVLDSRVANMMIRSELIALTRDLVS